jgi:hypothetical protein
MHDELKTTIRDDFLKWTGGFPPESDDQITVYLDYACPIAGDETELRSFLREWSRLCDEAPTS